jgi:hypothetical protein
MTIICWQQSKTTGNKFEGGTSTSLTTLRTVFNGTIQKADVPTLRAMAVAARDHFYTEVADAVERFGPIEVWGEG